MSIENGDYEIGDIVRFLPGFHGRKYGKIIAYDSLSDKYVVRFPSGKTVEARRNEIECVS